MAVLVLDDIAIGLIARRLHFAVPTEPGGEQRLNTGVAQAFVIMDCWSGSVERWAIDVAWRRDLAGSQTLVSQGKWKVRRTA